MKFGFSVNLETPPGLSPRLHSTFPEIRSSARMGRGCLLIACGSNRPRNHHGPHAAPWRRPRSSPAGFPQGLNRQWVSHLSRLLSLATLTFQPPAVTCLAVSASIPEPDQPGTRIALATPDSKPTRSSPQRTETNDPRSTELPKRAAAFPAATRRDRPEPLFKEPSPGRRTDPKFDRERLTRPFDSSSVRPSRR
jgi:hypothetical protein